MNETIAKKVIALREDLSYKKGESFRLQQDIDSIKKNIGKILNVPSQKVTEKAVQDHLKKLEGDLSEKEEEIEKTLKHIESKLHG